MYSAGGLVACALYMYMYCYCFTLAGLGRALCTTARNPVGTSF